MSEIIRFTLKSCPNIKYSISYGTLDELEITNYSGGVVHFDPQVLVKTEKGEYEFPEGIYEITIRRLEID